MPEILEEVDENDTIIKVEDLNQNNPVNPLDIPS